MAIHLISGRGLDDGTYALSISFLCCDRRSYLQMERSTTRGPDRCFVNPSICVHQCTQLELPMIVRPARLTICTKSQI